MRPGFTADWVAALSATFDAGLTERLGELDRLSGDGDFGVNLATACERLRAALAAQPPVNAAGRLTAVSRAFLGVGGTSGPLFGMFFRDLARHSPGAEPTAAGLAAGFAAGLATVQRLGGAAVGDKTMVDALAPAVAALAGSAGDAAGLAAAARAGIAGALATRDRTARRGRASYVGDAARGVLDPGAVTAAVIVACAAAAAAGSATAVDTGWLDAVTLDRRPLDPPPGS